MLLLNINLILKNCALGAKKEEYNFLSQDLGKTGQEGKTSLDNATHFCLALVFASCSGKVISYILYSIKPIFLSIVFLVLLPAIFFR